MQKTGRIHTESFGFGNEICPFFLWGIIKSKVSL